MNDTIICARYARYSSPNQKDISIEGQLQNCKEFAESKGWIVPEEYIFFDRAISGRNVAPREGFKALMSISTSGKCPFQKIIIDSTSRVARNTREALNIFSLLTYYGIHVYYITQGIATEDETAEEMITVHGLVDSLYIKNLARDTHRGIKGQVLKGFSGGGKRYGYRSEPIFSGKVDIYGMPEAEGYKLKIYAEEAETTLKAYKLFGEDGYSARKIIKLFNKELIEAGKPRPPKGKFWAVSSLLGSPNIGKGILSNPIYNGKYYWNRRKKLRHPETGKEKAIVRDKDQWILVMNPELKIIDDDLWEKVQKKRKLIEKTTEGKYTKGKIFYSPNLFAGLLKCAHCGGNIVIVSGGKFPKYGCSNNWNRGDAVCGACTKIKKSELEDAVISSLNLSFENEAVLSGLQEKVNLLLSKRAANEPEWEKGAFNNQLEQIERDIENYVHAIQFGIISDIVKNKLAEAEKKRGDIISRLEEFEKEETISFPAVSSEELRHYTRNLRGTLSLYPPLGKEFFQSIISQIRVITNEGLWTVEVIYKNEQISEMSHSSEHLSVFLPKKYAA